MPAPPPARGCRTDGSVDHAACAVAAAAPGDSPTGAGLEDAWIGRLSLRTPLTSLRAAWSYARSRIRRTALRVDVDAGRVPDCPACTDSCCRAPHLVSLRLEDVAALHDAGLGWAVEAGHAAERAAVYTDHPELRAVEGRSAFREFPVLRHTEDGACVFLDAAARCSVYALRPHACRAFPYRLDDNLRTVRYSTGCPASRRDGSGAEQEALANAVAATFDAKVRDLLMLRFAGDALERLGLRDYLPGTDRGRRFAAAVSKARSGAGEEA